SPGPRSSGRSASSPPSVARRTSVRIGASYLPAATRSRGTLPPVEAAFFDLDTAVIDPSIYLEALDLIALHPARRRSRYLVSASPVEVGRPLARRVGATGIFATRAATTTAATSGRSAAGPSISRAAADKAVAIRAVAAREGIDLSRSYAYADSISDLPML